MGAPQLVTALLRQLLRSRVALVAEKLALRQVSGDTQSYDPPGWVSLLMSSFRFSPLASSRSASFGMSRAPSRRRLPCLKSASFQTSSQQWSGSAAGAAEGGTSSAFAEVASNAG